MDAIFDSGFIGIKVMGMSTDYPFNILLVHNYFFIIISDIGHAITVFNTICRRKTFSESINIFKQVTGQQRKSNLNLILIKLISIMITSRNSDCRYLFEESVAICLTSVAFRRPH